MAEKPQSEVTTKSELVEGLTTVAKWRPEAIYHCEKSVDFLVMMGRTEAQAVRFVADMIRVTVGETMARRN